ncbi:MAG: hypothetical protein ACR2PH_01440 [Desulfobulbia bacterium]
MNEKGFEPYLLNALSERGVTVEEHETKMKNLAALGPVVIKAITHDCYRVKGREECYNPYTDNWM